MSRAVTSLRTNDPDRDQVVECGRFLAAATIIWLHTAGGGDGWEVSLRWTRWAVPFFVAASLWYSAPKAADGWRFFGQRFFRLYPVFLLWNSIYLGARVAAALMIGGGTVLGGSNWLVSFFIDGFAHHLWFLNFLILVHLGQALACSLHIPNSIRQILSVLALGVLALISYPTGFVPGYAFGGYLMELVWWTLPAALWFMLIRPVVRHWETNRGAPGRAALFLLAGLLVTFVSTLGERNPLLEGLSGVLLFSGALLTDRSRRFLMSPSIQWLAGCSGGIYLVHVLFVEGLQDILRDKADPLLVFPAALALSVLSSALLRWIAPRWVFSGFRIGKARPEMTTV